METLILIAFCMFVLYGLLQFVAWIGRGIFGSSAQPEPPANPWDHVNAVVSMPVQRPDGSFERARIVWESDPPAAAKTQRPGGRQP